MKKIIRALGAVAVLGFGLVACSAPDADVEGSGSGASGSASSSEDESSGGKDSGGKNSGRTGGCGASTMRAGESWSVPIESGGKHRMYQVTTPAEYQADDQTPVVLAFHGMYEHSETMKRLSGFSDKPAIAVYPQGLDGGQGTAWQGAGYSPKTDDVKFTEDILDRVESDLCVDKDRVFAAGFSNGGGFVNLLACRMSDRISAFASVAGAYYEGTRDGCEKASPEPFMEFHGTEDGVMTYRGGDGKGGKYLSVEDFVDEWVVRNGCARDAEVDHPVDGVEHRLYERKCRSDTEVQQYRIDGGGHTWPGAPVHVGQGRDTPDLHATDLIWDFFTDHPAT